MTWTKIGDDFTDRPEVLEMSRSARFLHVEALIWCNRMLTDGRLPRNVLRRISDSEDIAVEVDELVNAGIWTVIDDSAWQLDWTDQDDAETVRARQDAKAAKQRRYRDRKARCTNGDHSKCDPRFCKKAVTGNATSNEDGNEDGLVTHSRPVPSRPKGQGTGAGGAGARSPNGARAAPRLGEEHDFAEDRFGGCTECNLPAHHPIHAEHPHPFVRIDSETAACRVCGQTGLGWLHQGENTDATDDDKKYGSGRKAS